MQGACQSSVRSVGSGRRIAQVLFDVRLGDIISQQDFGLPALAHRVRAGVFRRPYAQFLPVAGEIRPDFLTFATGHIHIGFAAG
jgi:hypothetical protein